MVMLLSEPITLPPAKKFLVPKESELALLPLESMKAVKNPPSPTFDIFLPVTSNRTYCFL